MIKVIALVVILVVVVVGWGIYSGLPQAKSPAEIAFKQKIEKEIADLTRSPPPPTERMKRAEKFGHSVTGGNFGHPVDSEKDRPGRLIVEVLPEERVSYQIANQMLKGWNFILSSIGIVIGTALGVAFLIVIKRSTIGSFFDS